MYKNRCYMPFILYPPDMYDVSGPERSQELESSLELTTSGTDFVMYLSVPYCRVRCKACPYFVDLLPKNSDKKADLMDRYVDALVLDLKRHAATERWGNAILRGVYIGGGTGSLLEIHHMDKVLGTLSRYFRLSDDCEITLEGNADERGSREYNMGLGERRGNAVSSALQANGGSGSQINVVSYGEERPTCTESDSDSL